MKSILSGGKFNNLSYIFSFLNFPRLADKKYKLKYGTEYGIRSNVPKRIQDGFFPIFKNDVRSNYSICKFNNFDGE